MINRFVDQSLKYVLIFLMAFMVLDVTWQVVTRFLMQDPSSYTEEIARFLLIWIGLLGAAYAYRNKVHLGIDVLVIKLRGPLQPFAELIAHLLSFLFAGSVMLLGGIRLVSLTLELNQMSAAMGIKMGYVYSVIPISGLLIMHYSFYFMLDSWKRLRTNKPSPISK